jgi:hypothetical protein
MQRLDLLRISLLAGLTGCGTTLDDGESDGHTTTTMGTSVEGEGTLTGSDETETGEDRPARARCAGRSGRG